MITVTPWGATRRAAEDTAISGSPSHGSRPDDPATSTDSPLRRTVRRKIRVRDAERRCGWLNDRSSDRDEQHRAALEHHSANAASPRREVRSGTCLHLLIAGSFSPHRVRQATTAKEHSHSAHAPILRSRSQIGAVCGPYQRTKQRSITRYNADQRQTMFAGQRCSRGRDQEACLVSQKILSISATVPSPGGQVSGMASRQEKCRGGSGGQGVASPRPPFKDYHTPARGQSGMAHTPVPSRVAPGLACGRALPGRGDATQLRRARSSVVALSW